MLWNVVTLLGRLLNGDSVRTMLYKTPPLYLIVLASLMQILGIEDIEFHRIEIMSPDDK